METTTTLREFVFGTVAPLFEASGQRLAAVCRCRGISESTGPDDACPKCGLVAWAVLRILTTGGNLYVTEDEKRRKAYAVEGRVVVRQDELAAEVPRLLALEPYDRHLWLCSLAERRAAAPLAPLTVRAEAAA